MFDPQKGVNPLLSASVLFLGFQSDDLFTGVVAPTTCSLTTCLTTCKGDRFHRQITCKGDRFHRQTTYKKGTGFTVENCPESPAAVKTSCEVELAGYPGDFQRLKHGLGGQTGHPESGR